MIVHQAANCNNAPKNLKVALMTKAILENDRDKIREHYDGDIEPLLFSSDGVDTITITSAISHGKSASSLCVYEDNGRRVHVGYFFQFTTFKAERFEWIICTHEC